VDFDQAARWLVARAGELVDAQLLSRGDGARPLAQLSGRLTLAEDDHGPHDAARPLSLGIGEGTLWVWPERFVAADPIGSGAALEVVMDHVVYVVGPTGLPWVD
jgi:hypothetical protein